MEISQHIKNLLKTNERVILGDFGVFTTKQISARIDKETKVMKPPFKIVVFDQNITEDAGLLIKYMAEQKRISIDNAKEQIEEYVKTIKSKLAAGKTIEFKDMGSFKQSADGKIDFSYLSDDNLLLDSFGLPPVTITEQNNLKSPPIERKQPIRKTPLKKPEVKEEQKQPIKKSPPVIKEKPPVKEAPPIKKAPPVKKEIPVQTKSTSEKPKKKRKWLAIVIPIVAIGIMLAAIYFFKPDLWNKGYSFSVTKLSFAKEKIAGLFNSDDSGKYDVIPDVVHDIDTQAIDTENITDTSSTEKIVEEIDEYADEAESNNEDVDNYTNETSDNNETVDVTVNENPNSGNSGRYYIIISSLSSQSAAQNEQKRFARKGISTDIIHVAHMNRYRLSIGDFGSAKEAQNYFTNFQSKHGNIDAWVWEKR
ncbi:MAG: SPOR domain-containing protein [Bacteroidales bacterium]|nr:SPOR domain-containing protein [Bacteroidales bacterium]